MEEHKETITCLVCEPGKNPKVKEVEYKLEAFLKAVGYSAEIKELSKTACMIRNREPQYKGLLPNQNDGSAHLLGTYLIVGITGQLKQIVSLSDEDIEKYCEELKVEPEKEIRCLVVEPNKLPSIQVIPNTLEAKQQLVGGLIEEVYLSETASLICNEEGKLLGLKPNRFFGNDVIAGTFLVVGVEEDNENYVSLSDNDILKYSRKFHRTVQNQMDDYLQALKEIMMQ